MENFQLPVASLSALVAPKDFYTQNEQVTAEEVVARLAGYKVSDTDMLKYGITDSMIVLEEDGMEYDHLITLFYQVEDNVVIFSFSFMEAPDKMREIANYINTFKALNGLE